MQYSEIFNYFLDDAYRLLYEAKEKRLPILEECHWVISIDHWKKAANAADIKVAEVINPVYSKITLLGIPVTIDYEKGDKQKIELVYLRR